MTPQVYNHVNYTELKDYRYPEFMGKAHDGNVRALIFVKEHALLISASGDRSISIHDDSKVHLTAPRYTQPTVVASPLPRRKLVLTRIIVHVGLPTMLGRATPVFSPWRFLGSRSYHSDPWKGNFGLKLSTLKPSETDAAQNVVLELALRLCVWCFS